MFIFNPTLDKMEKEINKISIMKISFMFLSGAYPGGRG
jgi:hypothetical protein